MEKLSLFLLLTLLSSLHTHARDSQFFNKIPSTTNNAVVPTTTTTKEAPFDQQDPTFLPQNEESYGLYGHESGQNPPSTAAATTTTPAAAAEFKQPTHKYLPKNYNPVAYVTQPEDVNDATAFNEQKSFTTDNNNNKNYYNNYYNNNQQPQREEEASEFRTYVPSATTNSFYYSGGSSFNSQPQGGDGAAFQPQGMSDTRHLENGKYFYDINSEKYSRNHPYTSLRGVNVQPQNEEEFNNRNFYGNNAANEEFNNRNFYRNNAASEEFNGEDSSMGGYQEFQNEDNNMP